MQPAADMTEHPRDARPHADRKQHAPARYAALGAACVGLLLLGLTSGCVPQYTDYDAFMTEPRPIVGGRPYVIEPPDTIRVIAPEAPEIHDQSKRLRPDGFITFYLLGDIFAAGKTPTQLASEIEEKISRFYRDVKVQIEVTGFNSKVYYTAGETSQGPKPYTGQDTVLDAVLSAGVPRTARPSRLIVLRPNEDRELIRRMTIDFTEMTEKGDLTYNAVLEEGDIIFMPINPLAAVGVAIGNLLLPVDPAIELASTPARASGVPLP